MFQSYFYSQYMLSDITQKIIVRYNLTVKDVMF
jgi:hypothetical protein